MINNNYFNLNYYLALCINHVTCIKTCWVNCIWWEDCASNQSGGRGQIIKYPGTETNPTPEGIQKVGFF